MIRRKIMIQKWKRGNPKENTCFKDSMQDQSIGLVLMLSGLKKISVQKPQFYQRMFQSNIQGQVG